MSAFPDFEVVPAVDLQDGEVVQLVQGERGTEKRYGDPVDAAERWIDQGAETLHLVDLDGAFEGERANAEAVEQIVRSEEHTSELQSPNCISYAVFCLEFRRVLFPYTTLFRSS